MVKIVFDAPNDTASVESVQPLVLTDAACKRLQVIFAKQTQQPVYMRVAIVGGGCNGFNYKFELTHDVAENDAEIKNDNFADVTVLVDPESHGMLGGSTLDFEETLEASRFVVNNPNAKSSCGCGTSFGM